MAMKRRLRIALWVLAVSVVLMVVLLFVGWRFYKVYRSPERFIAMGRELVESGEQKAAMDQYRRALRYTRTAEKRADVLREMAKSLKEQGPLPVEEALENYRSLMSVWASIARVDRTDQATREKLLDAHYRIARQSGAAWAWRNLFEVAQMMERLDDESLLARKYLTIAKLRVDDGQTDGAVFYDEINEELRKLRDLRPDDVDLPYSLGFGPHASVDGRE